MRFPREEAGTHSDFARGQGRTLHSGWQFGEFGPPTPNLSRRNGDHALVVERRSDGPFSAGCLPRAHRLVAVGLGAIGGVLALVASILGIRAKRPNEAFQSGSTEIWRQLRLTSWVVLPGSLAVLAGVGLQIIQLLQRC